MMVQFVTKNGHRGRVYPVLCVSKNYYNGKLYLIEKRNDWTAASITESRVEYVMPGFDIQEWNRIRVNRSTMFSWVTIGNGWTLIPEDNETAIQLLQKVEGHDDEQFRLAFSTGT